MGRADFRNAALVALLAEPLTDLEEERSVPKRRTTLHAFAASDASLFVDGIFEIGILNILALDGVSRATQIFGCGVKLNPFVLIIPAAEEAISAGCVLMNAFHGRVSKDTSGLALAALNTFVWINLPQERRLPTLSFSDKPEKWSQ